MIETLRSCTREEFEKYIDFAYGLAMDLTKSGYPTYCDGIKTKESFIERSLKAFEREDEEMLLFMDKGEGKQAQIPLQGIPVEAVVGVQKILQPCMDFIDPTKWIILITGVTKHRLFAMAQIHTLER